MHASGPLVGILGGMGPLATADFMAHLVKLTPATRDQDHCRSLVYSNPRIPDRSQAILRQGTTPLPDLLDGVAMLVRGGADVIAIPCNSAHFWLSDLAAAAPIPIISIVDAVCTQLRRQQLLDGRIGVLGTMGLVMSNIYQDGLGSSGYEAVRPTESELSDLVEPAIRAVKAGEIERARAPILRAIEAIEARAVRAVVLGCTELALAMPAPVSAGGLPLIDSTRARAAACIDWVAAFKGRRATDPAATVAA